MKKILTLIFVGVSFVGCATTGLQTKTGAAAVSMFQESGMATGEANASKMGQACTQNILGIASVGDASIEAAKKAGHIMKVSSVDYDVFNVLFVYGKLCTIVRGN